MKRIILVLIAFLTCSGFSQSIDWRQTFHMNATMDYLSTLHFMDRGGIELNPILAPVVNRGDRIGFTVISITYAYGATRIIDSIKDKGVRNFLYGVLSVIHGYLAYRNGQQFGFGFPLVAVRF